MMAPAASGGAESRLGAARRALTDLVALLHGDRVGLVAFEGDAQVLCPLTLADGAMGLIRAADEPVLLPTPASDLSAGLEQAIAAFPGKERKFKVIVLLSDGEDTAGSGYVHTAKRAAGEGI